MQVVKIILCFIFIYQPLFSLVSYSLECKNGQSPSRIAYTITVSQSGPANFTNITNAFNSIPSPNSQWVKIFVNPGIYKEKIEVPHDKQCIILEGKDRLSTIITYDARGSDSVTFINNADNFVARGITFRNSRNLENKEAIYPAVAYRALGDKQAYYSCGFEGYQDTLWDDRGRHYFKSCYIKGAIDFIWGDGQSVYEESRIDVIGSGFITAQGREAASETSGYVFRGCSISGNAVTFLGRPYRQFGRTIFIDSNFANIIKPEGWDIWLQGGHENDVTFAEVNCKGAGADISKRVKWMKTLSASDLAAYNTNAFVDQDGWISKLP